ncbi:MAG: hypothetical protein EXR98_00880 [Gemmataceae bacterium]|nr:hypothetical protein [Gemmataceae bacterium]
MFTPVFLWELRDALRQRWFINVRRLYVLIVLLWFLWYLFDIHTRAGLWFGALRRDIDFWVTGGYLHGLWASHVAAILVLTPILAVGEVMRAKNQRVIELLLTSRLDSLEIVGGYWLATIAKVVVVTSPGIPLLVWVHVAFRTPWWEIVAFIVCSWLPALPIAAWALLVAIHFRRTSSAILVVYLGPVAAWVMAFAVYGFGRELFYRRLRQSDDFWLAVALIVFFLCGIPCLILAIWRLRSTLSSQQECRARARGTWSPPPIDDQPIYWKQSYASDWFMFKWLLRMPAWGRVGLFVIATCAASSSSPSWADGTPSCETVLILIAFPLAALVMCASTVSTERESRTWDPLRGTMIRADEYVEQTLRAILPRLFVYWLAILPAVAILTSKRFAVAGVFVPIAWLTAGVLMRAAAAVGFYHSARKPTSSASILTALIWFALHVSVCGLAGMLVTASIIGVLSTRFELGPEFRLAGGEMQFRVFWPGVLLVISTSCLALAYFS